MTHILPSFYVIMVKRITPDSPEDVLSIKPHFVKIYLFERRRDVETTLLAGRGGRYA
jgi:hypothetical protein